MCLFAPSSNTDRQNCYPFYINIQKLLFVALIIRLALVLQKGDYNDQDAKEITLDGLSKENIKVFPKKDLFGKHSKIFDCSESGCGSEEVSKEQKKKLSKCTYEGTLKDDPDSRVNLIMCDPKGSQNLVILSDKVCFIDV